ncbi:MAG: GNAT family N-acetyltransferase [Gammaproteobacteria bacterium]|nr:GNAT family N-acetyltransferase [Gammaproteobacteria bacterium]
MFTFNKVIFSPDINTVANLAHEIWNQHFVPIIGQAQVDYMLEKFQSVDAISEQINDGYEYYIINNLSENVGYLGLVSNLDHSRMMISKIYIKLDSRGAGVGSATLNYVEQLSRERQINTVWLTVNRYNQYTIDWYIRNGFVITDEVKKDIGNGFYMDDYIMEFKII